jgi:hypothetical protein
MEKFNLKADTLSTLKVETKDLKLIRQLEILTQKPKPA